MLQLYLTRAFTPLQMLVAQVDLRLIYEVLMTRPLLSDFMASLDRAAAQYSDSKIKGGFRASSADTQLERTLRGAAVCHTPHLWVSQRFSKLGAHVAQQA